MAPQSPLRQLQIRRQHPLLGYIADFCAELHLVIEMDGQQHEAVWMNEYDSSRTLKLMKHGIDVLRIPNHLLARDAIMVEEMIREAIRRRESTM